LFFFTGTHLDYHKPSDTFEKINYEGLRRIFGYVSEIVRAIDSNPKRPTYTVAKSLTPPDTGRRSFNVTLGTIPGYSDGTDGMLIEGVREGTPAAKTGLKAGDKIIKLAGKDIRNVQDYTVVLGELKADVEYEIIIKRGTEVLTLKITPVARR
jgi:S1-C subfamily serine protease